MTWPNPPDWAIYTGAAACLLIGLPLLYWSLWRDRPRGRLRCPRCWYDMSAPAAAVAGGGSPAPFEPVTCPECGRVARSARDLRRTRRRWAVAVGAMVLVAGAPVLAAWPAIRARGFWPSVPTTVLLGAESLLGVGTWPDLTRAREQRLGMLNHSAWQWRLLLQRAGGGLADVRTRWPRGATIRVPSASQKVLASALYGVVAIELTPLDVLPEAPSPVRRAPGEPLLTHEPVWTDGTVPVAPGPGGTVRYRARILDSGNATLHDLEIAMPLDLRADIDDVLEPVPLPARDVVDYDADGTLNVRLVTLPTSGRPAIDIGAPGSSLGIVRGVRIDVLLDGRVIASTRTIVPWMRGEGLPALLEGDLPALQEAMRQRRELTAAVTSDDEMSLAQTSDRVTRRWVGRFETRVWPPAASPAAPGP